MTTKTEIERKLVAALAPLHLEVIDETTMHNVPPDSESHFRVVVVSVAFAGMSLVQRHREINGVLSAELATRVHALAISALTPSEHDARAGTSPSSPPCRGGTGL
ncbi:MAG: BolA/IbaG family iron-sulfur metabolism protein [Nannocystaceae bacterium]